MAKNVKVEKYDKSEKAKAEKPSRPDVIIPPPPPSEPTVMAAKPVAAAAAKPTAPRPAAAPIADPLRDEVTRLRAQISQLQYEASAAGALRAEIAQLKAQIAKLESAPPVVKADPTAAASQALLAKRARDLEQCLKDIVQHGIDYTRVHNVLNGK